MPYEVLTEWSSNLIAWTYRYSITQEEIAERAKISTSYMNRLLHMQKPSITSCEKVDRAVRDALKARDFDPQKYVRQQKRRRSQL